jgi:hypothetical protein
MLYQLGGNKVRGGMMSSEKSQGLLGFLDPCLRVEFTEKSFGSRLVPGRSKPKVAIMRPASANPAV